jgi:hypothetical protein
VRSKLIWGLVIGLLSGAVNAQSESQAYLMCGTVACAPNINDVFFVGVVTGIDDLNVGGDLFDVAFMSTAPVTSPFVLSDSTAGPGQPLTGIDAADAISEVYALLVPPFGSYPLGGDPGPAFITAFEPAGSLSSEYFGATTLWDVAQTIVGGTAKPGQVFGNNGFSTSPGVLSDNGGNEIYYTTWTPIAAPEIDPNATASGVALLLGGLAILRGRKQRLLLH